MKTFSKTPLPRRLQRRRGEHDLRQRRHGVVPAAASSSGRSRCLWQGAGERAAEAGAVCSGRASLRSNSWAGSDTALRAENWRVIAEAREARDARQARSEEHTSELQSQSNLVCRLLLEKKKKNT